MKRHFYLEIIITRGKRFGVSAYFLTRYFKKYSFMFRKVFLLFLCLKFLFLDPFSFLPSKAQTTNDFNLSIVQSKPVSFDTSLSPTAIQSSSLPVSFNITNLASAIQLSSNPVSYSTIDLASAIQLSSNPVSYSISQTAEAIRLTSLPASYSLTSFTGEALKLTSDNVSYKVFNGIPLLGLISPNLLPISQNGGSIDVSLEGDNFVQDSVASIGTLKIQTKYVSPNKLITTIPANYLNKENNFEIFVANPPPLGGVSKGFNVMVVNPIPIAKINATPSIGVAPQIITFDGRTTEDLLAKYFGQALSYSWNLGDLENSTEENQNTSTDPVISHTYKKPGKYIARLNVVNAYGKTSAITKEIEIREKNFAPEGVFILNETKGDVPLSITFTANVSDKENDEISYYWEFGDGQTSTEQNPSHTYTIPGKYQPKLIVNDILGAKTTITSTKITLLPPNNLPITQIAAVPKESILKQNKEGFFTSEVQFVSNGTYDPDNEELTYTWDFGDNTTSNEVSPKHEYKDSGTYNVKLTVSDTRRGESSKTISTIVLKPQPLANAKLDQTTGNAPFEVTFDGSSSQDYDGKAVSIKLDFGDGNSQIIDSTQGIIKHTYQDPGVYLASLTAFTPDNRLKKINIGNVIVGANNTPVGQITKLEGNDSGIVGQAMIKLSAVGSFDPQNPNTPLQYKWIWSARTWDVNGNLIDLSDEVNNELISTNEEFEYTFTKAGQYTPILEIEKSDGTKTRFYGETYTITPDQAPVAIAKILSDKNIGEPGLEINFDASESYDPKAGGGLQILTWDFGDGEKSTEISPKHTYNSEGTFTPTLVVVDNENNVGFAQASSIKIAKYATARSVSNEALFRSNNVILSDSEESTNVKRFFVADAPQNDTYTKEEIESAIESMIKEVTDIFISSDNKKPEIGPITIEPKTVNPGGAVRLSCFVRDNIGLSNFGYTLYGLDEKIITQKVIDLESKNKDNSITNEQYLEESISIPADLPPGLYTLKLSATDTNGNQIARNSSTAEQETNEEIAITFNVGLNVDELGVVVERIALPSAVSDFVEKGFGDLGNREYGEKKELTPYVIARKFEKLTKQSHERSNTYEIATSPPLEAPRNDVEIQDLINQGFFVRGFVGETKSPQKSGETEAASLNTRVAASNSAQKITKLQTAGFEISNFNYVVNPWVTISPSSSNSLTLDVITERDGYIELGWKGSLANTPFAKWTKTNVYVDSKLAGSIQWWAGAGISFTSTTTNPRIKVEFRPTDNSGNELASGTWTSGYFTFTKTVQPQISSIFPTEGTAGRGAFDLRINGNNFRETSRVYFDGYLLTPFANDANTIYIRIPANLVQYLGGKSISVLNSDGSQSNISYYTAKANQSNVCNLKKTLPQTYWGSDSTTVLSGNNTFLSSPSATIQGSGSVSTPFCLDNTYDVKTSLNLSHYKSGTPDWNYVDFWIDGNLISRSFVQTSQTLSWENLDTRTLSSGLHELKISFNGNPNDLLYVNDVIFTNNSGPKLYSISPNNISLEGNKRILTINGDNFDQNTNVTIDNQIITKNSVNKNQIIVYIPDKFSSPGAKLVQLHGNGKDSSILSLAVTDDFKLVDSSFKITPIQPFPGNSFDVELKVKGNNPNATYTAYIAVFDPDGKLLTAINNSNNFSTTTINGVKDSNGDTFFKDSIPLNLQSKNGNCKVIATVQRNSSIGEEFTSIEALKYLAARSILSEYSDTLIPASHRLTFTPKPAVGTIFGIEENSSDNVGFVQVGNKVIQDGHSIKYKVQISTGQEYSSNLRYNFKSGDGRESLAIANDNYTFTYQNTNKSLTTPQIANPQVDLFWNENGVQTKIGTYNGPTVFIYPNYNPIAKAKVSGDTFTTTPPLFTTFVDLDSYDPNQRFSSALDFVDSKLNNWKLFELRFNQDSQLVSLPIDGKVSEDGKSFYSGSLFTPGSYFATLTVKDKAGLTDTASTESVTLTKPSQRVIVFATTNPSDKKVYDPNVIAGSNSDEVIPSGTAGIPVRFKSDVKVLGGHVQSQTYKWDFGDESCKGNSLPDDCTSPNPTHYYFDNNKSFNGSPYTDRKSVTPKLTVSTVFRSGQKETWEASAGTITFNAEPNFVLLDVRPEQASGIVPLTVNLMIDNETAKAVNATVSKYELDWGDSVIASPFASLRVNSSEESHIELENITLDQLLTKTFTHTYTTPGTYTPKLTVYIEESIRKFVFNVPEITVAGTGTSGVYLLDDLSDVSFTNQSIVTFMVLTSFANPDDPNNSLKIKVRDEDENETTTELDQTSENQTISLSEGINTYYFETVDSSDELFMSEEREIIVDTEAPLLNIESPNENDLILPENKLLISGTIEDKQFHSISYRINENNSFKELYEDDIEELDNGKKAFSIVIDPNTLDSPLSKVEINVKDRAGNITSDEININDNRQIKLLSNVSNNDVQIIYNDGQPHNFKQGEPFELVIKSKICDDDDLPVSDSETPFELQVNDLSKLQFGTKEILLNGKGAYPPINSNTISNSGTLGDIDGCSSNTYDVYESFILNRTLSNELFDINANSPDPTLYWTIGQYNFSHTITSTDTSRSHFGTTLENYSTQLTNNFIINITRDYNAKISALKPQNLLWNKLNNITFNLNLYDSIPIKDQDHLPRLGQAYIQTPTGERDNVTVSCNYQPNILSPTRELAANCSFSYTPKELTKDSSSYTLTLPISFSPDSGNLTDSWSSYLANFKDIKSNPEVAVEIIQPEEYTVIQSSKTLIKSILDKAKLPVDLQALSTDKIKNLAKYGIRFGSDDVIRIVTSSNNNDSVIKGIMASSLNEDTVSFEYNLNFNLSTENNFKDAFENLSAIGPIFLYNEITTLSPSVSTFPTESYAEPQELILLDKPVVKGALKTNSKTNTKVLNLTIKNNIPSYGPKGKRFPLELVVEPKDESGMILGNLGEFNTSVLIPKGQQSKTKKIENLPPETTEALVTLNRSDDFLNFVQDKLNKNKFNFNILNGQFKTVSTVPIFDPSVQITFCNLEPNAASISQSIDFNYALKSTKSAYVSINGKKPDGTIDKSIPLPVEFKDKTDWAQSGIISFTLPQAWSIYTEVIFTLTSGGESDVCELKIGESSFFTESSNETDTINLPFVTNGTATISDDPILGVKGLSFSSNDKISLKDFKRLLKDLKLLSEDNNNGYDLETQEATYELLYTIDQLRCVLKDDNRESNLKAQITGSTLTCGISSTNYLEYISTSTKTNLPYIVSLINSANTLRTIGTISPQVNASGLSNSVLLNGLANAAAIGAGTLSAPDIAAIGLLGLVLYFTLSHAQLKSDTTDTTCTNVIGIIDRRFFIGKDLNNLDIKRTNTMVSISATNELFNTNLKVIEPFSHIPLQPGIFTGCIQNGQYNIHLQFNEQNTFSMTANVPQKTLLNLPSPIGNFWGGVFRKYGRFTTVDKVIQSRTILNSPEGDIQTILNPTGAGAYLTRLSLQPNINVSVSEIAEALRLYASGTFEAGKPSSKGILEPDRAEAFIDLVVNTFNTNLITNETFPLQFVLPNSQLNFDNPGEASSAILIDKLGQ